MEGKCISSDNKENIVSSPYTGGIRGRKFHKDKKPSLCNRTPTPVPRRKIVGRVLLPNKCDLGSLKCKKESRTQKTSDYGNETYTSKGNGELSQSEKPSQKTTANLQLESTVQSFDSSSAFYSVDCTSPTEKTKTQNTEKCVTNDEEVLDWREVLEKFKEHIKNSTSRSWEENEELPKENMEKVVKQKIKNSCYSNKLKEIQTMSNSMSICDNMTNMENVGTDIKDISRKTAKKENAEFSQSEESPNTKLQKRTSTHSEMAIQTMDSPPTLSTIGTESPTEKINDPNSDQYNSRCGDKKVLVFSEFSSKYLHNNSTKPNFEGLEEDKETPKGNIEKAKHQDMRAFHHNKKLRAIQQEPCPDNFEAKSEKTNAEEVEISNSKPNLTNAVSATKHVSRRFMIGKQMRIGKKVVRKNETAPVKEISDLGTYEDFKKYLLRRANLKCTFMRDVDDVDDYEDFKRGIIANNGQIIRDLNSSLLVGVC
ncbi:uncharacterized protein LOC123314954 [Coccinella septempunctata]|uniref:uncharacterized protein LOC123314954 n=1 Tax=Coccinella septempunctata TaxID=41139 RepID=UPI001D0735AD|nr:uncharacterized protein LOC123314954 [Coccinella septempunctata]